MIDNSRKTKLKDLCKIEKGKIGITKAIEGEYPLVVTAEERSSHNEWHFDEPATIVPLVSSTGHGHASIKRLHYAEGKYAVGNILATLIPKDHKYLNAKYLYVYLTINKEELLVSQMTGAANVSLTLTRLAEVEIEVPDYETQLQVIKKYEDAQRYKNSMNSQIDTRFELLEKLRQQILQDAITGKLSEKWRKENPNIESAETLLEKIKTVKETLVKDGKIRKQKPLPPITENEIPFELPKEWVWCRLGEITNYGSSSKTTPSDIKEDTWVLDLEDIEKDTSKLISKIRFRDRKSLSTKSRFEKGDVLYSKLRPYLDKIIVADESGVCTTEILPLRTYIIINSKYLMFTLKRSDFLIYVNSKTKGMKMPRLGTLDGQLALIPLAPLQEQHYIVERIESLFTKLESLIERNIENQTNTDLLNQVLLNEMFSK